MVDDVSSTHGVTSGSTDEVESFFPQIQYFSG